MSRVVLAMSGGVDSSVAAWLLREQGHEVIGLFMRHGQGDCPNFRAGENGAVPFDSQCGDNGGAPAGRWPPAISTPSSPKQGCCTAADAADARRVADMLGIPFHAVNFEREFERIVDYFVAEYIAGRTPNPCIVCNTWLKFGRLFDYANQLGAEYVATGHYARLTKAGHGEVALCRGLDSAKDQSYVLFGIERRLLPRLLFPVGDYRKDEIRAMAERLGLRVAAKRDSQEICFVPDQDHARFVRERRGDVDTSGEIVTTEGVVVGHHDGFERYTIGQRKGLRLAFGEPRFVVRIEPNTRRVVIGVREELARQELVAAGANWLVARDEGTEIAGGQRPTGELREDVGWVERREPHHVVFRATVKIRYRSPAAPATVELLPDNRFRVCFDEPVHGIAPGQAAVCYDSDRVLGGGWIE